MTNVPIISPFLRSLSARVRYLTLLSSQPRFTLKNTTEPFPAYYARLQALHAASGAGDVDKMQGLITYIIDQGLKPLPQQPPETLLHAFGDLLSNLLLQNGIAFKFPELDPKLMHDPNYTTPLRRKLEDYEPILTYHEDIRGTFAHVMIGVYTELFANYLPPLGQGNTTLTVPLHALLKTPGQFFDRLYATFLGEAELNTAPNYQLALASTRSQFFDNLLVASKLTYEQAGANSHRLVFPSQSNEPTDALATTFFTGTPFYDFLFTPTPFVIPRKTYASHGIILAPPNHGKTQLLGNLAHGFLSEGTPIGMFVLDPHGDLFHNLRERVEPSRLITLDPDTSPPALNFLSFIGSTVPTTEAQALQTFSYLMSALSGGLSDKQGAIVPYLLKLLREIDGASIETLRQLVDEKVKRPEQSQFRDAIAALPDVDRGFFEHQFYSSRMQETKDAIGWKLYSALSSDAFRKMFSAKTNSVDFDACIHESKVVLVKGARNALGDEGMRVFLQYVVAQYFAAGLRRERIDPNHRSLCLMVVDEAHTVMSSPLIANILTELRKYACGFVGATQVLHQIADDVKAAVYGATAIKIAGPVSHNDASVLAREMYCGPEFLRSMRAVERSHAEWAFYVTGMTDRAVKVRVPYGVLEAMPAGQATAPQHPPQTHEGPSKPEPSRMIEIQSAEPDTPIVPYTSTPDVVPGKFRTK